ncbi:MAG: AgmX/PglI C-terminal domain-containing protein [Silvanigrellaceae bacterium]
MLNKLFLSKIVLMIGVTPYVACVSMGSKDGEPEPISAAAVTPAQISPEECVNYVQLKRDEDFQCELSDGSTRPLKPGERRSTPLSREEIEKVIASNREDTQLCFESLLPKDAKLEGKLYITFDIESGGKVANATYNEGRSTYKNPKLGACLVNKVKNWRFPVLTTEDTLQINYPFHLISAEAAPQEKGE